MSKVIHSVAFLGLGAMGYRMAAHLPKQFQDVRVWNRTSSKAEQHAAQYHTQAVSLHDALQADVIISCLPTSQDVEQLIITAKENGAFNTANAGKIWIDCTSGVPDDAKRIRQILSPYGIDFLDAPVSGQTIGAENATLTFMVGGDEQVFQRALVVMQVLGKLIQHVGETGAGFAVKAVNNMLLAANLCATLEGFSTLKAHGVALDSALACINASSGKSVATEMVLPQRILNREFPLTFALTLLNKDTGIALDLAQQAKLSTPVLALARQMVNMATSQATPQHDFSTLAQWYEQFNHLTLE